MHAFIQFEYNGFSKLTRDEYENLRTTVKGLDPWREDEDKAPSNWASEDHLIDMATEGVELVRLGVKFWIKKFKNTYIANPDAPRAEALHVHIPNIGLLAINQVTWLDDACTEDLQAKLEEGWRIVAVCPPNAARRPDYILGRTR